jgi:hypothetical protein
MATVDNDTLTIREKTTSPIEFITKADGEVINLTGIYEVEFRMLDKLGNTYKYGSLDASPAVVITGYTTGVITFTPPNEDVFLYRRSPYKCYIRLWETDISNYSIPESTYNIIEVLKEY